MDKIKYFVEVELEGNPQQISDTADEIDSSIKTNIEDDFGEQAWGGYEGAVVKSVTVTKVESDLPEHRKIEGVPDDTTRWAEDEGLI